MPVTNRCLYRYTRLLSTAGGGTGGPGRRMGAPTTGNLRTERAVSAAIRWRVCQAVGLVGRLSVRSQWCSSALIAKSLRILRRSLAAS